MSVTKLSSAVAAAGIRGEDVGLDGSDLSWSKLVITQYPGTNGFHSLDLILRIHGNSSVLFLHLHILLVVAAVATYCCCCWRHHRESSALSTEKSLSEKV
mmetsp:Transcript_36212/g.61760  ORF Transcript_36212/g.61760 Transcript_36212/m.61760 type:complete len:100 (+) Transcript_36212:297-596(+)